jgi:hypothetical protein
VCFAYIIFNVISEIQAMAVLKKRTIKNFFMCAYVYIIVKIKGKKKQKQKLGICLNFCLFKKKIHKLIII